MPRRPSTTAEPTTVANGKLGDVDEQGLEKLPDFGPPLERTELRPDLCGNNSPWGVPCTREDSHSGAHSWQPESAEFVAHNRGPESEQSELPGTPAAEPEKTDYDVPFESQFNNRDLVEAPGLRTIGERLIEAATDQDGFDHLRGIEIHWFWKRRGGTQGGNPRYGGIKRPSSFEKHYTGNKVIYMVWLAADHVREARFTAEQIEACLYDQLTRTDVDPEDHDAYRIIGPDFVGSIRTLQRFGVWNADLREAAAHIQQLPLVQIETEDTDDGDAEDEAADGKEHE
jgi:hypothetical protein